ncbi:MAG TPA: winged helix-turn-helix domain-containing protein [Pyrinomonadaceae bacterium]|nr:winged helix-turn-helix domain-containing protein [Pyrinomonadaceae bacterium]
MQRDATSSYEFGGYSLDVSRRSLTREGRAVPLTTKLFDILLLFIRNSGRVITKEELMREIWPDSFVEESNITVSVSALRKALGEGHGRGEYIRTVPKRGYVFVAGVRELSREASSLAVMPLENQSADPSLEYLSDGITESIINSLSQLPRLRVMARATVFRYKGRGVDSLTAAREMGVRAVLTGRVLQLGESLIVRAELVDVADGSQIWGEQYDRRLQDLLAVQEEIARAISEKLRLRLTSEDRERLGKRHTESNEAYRLYVKGRYFLNRFDREGGQRCVRYFSEAVEIDPAYALAYAGLADSYYRLANTYLAPVEAMPKAKAAALRAVELDATLAEARTSLGFIKMVYDWDWAGAAREFERAVELNFGSPLAHTRRGWHLALLGRFDEAVAELRVALELDPLSLFVNMYLASVLYYARRYEEAIGQCRKTLELDPNYFPAHGCLGESLSQLGDYASATAELERALAVEDNSEILGWLGRTHALAGRRGEAEAVIEELTRRARRSYVSTYPVAVVRAALGERDAAVAAVERLLDDRNEILTQFGVDPKLDALRPDPRFREVLRRVGLAS